MSKKLTGNGRWESSRMMLPEHRESLIQLDREREKRRKPDLDEQHQEDMAMLLQESLQDKLEIELVTFGGFGDDVTRGVVEDINTYLRRIRIATAAGVEWVPLDDLVEVNRPY